MCAALLLLLTWLSGHPIWTQEYRWQQVCQHMLISGDYWHPYLDGKPYYDKPLLSYWLMLGVAPLVGGLNLIALRLPSVGAALGSLYCLLVIGRYHFDRATGLLAAWLMLSCFYFVFWGRVASADMLNVVAILVPTAWLLTQHHRGALYPGVFWLMLAIGALLKGLIAPVLTCLVMLPWLCQQRRIRVFYHWRSLLWAAVAAGLYLSPFIVSNLSHASAYHENGLMQVFQENIVRFFKPFDHQGGLQTYFIYGPLYLLPWTPIWCVALILTLRHWRDQPSGMRWLLWAVASIFVFLSLSGSRRSYYILPWLPFALLFTAAWWRRYATSVWQRRLLISIGVFYGLFLCYFALLQPCYYRWYVS